METGINRLLFLRSYLEKAYKDASERGLDVIVPTIIVDDAKMIVKALNLMEDSSKQATAGEKKTCETVIHNSPFSDTVDGMLSPDYRERFKAEYQQTKIRYEKLKAFNNRIEAATITNKVEMPNHDCPADLLIEQEFAMGEYLHILEVRAEIEGIKL